ncbi:hypothetical protein B6S12_07950 [Helicobacter valdiviensis]|uniref:Nucleotidyl transferase domain-containing protein n=1 Tax=Helicobacter valdiviensis TaxID=1458358 RepID=A0A2W6NJV1_9HELI|nr:sugar phosphate nucleotidyltransferase [Helicobacter valdiviensis]PZT47656.1 hypothetical protein B6S12_07950 [Helicobacter valdiviensis]
MRAIILAAGEGKRLRPLTLNKPKPLLEIRGKTLLENMIFYLKKLGVKEIFVITGYKNHLFTPLEKKLGFKQIFYKDYKNKNSAATLQYVSNLIQKGTFILNGDLFINKEFSQFLRFNSNQFLAQKITNAPFWGYLTDENSKLIEIDTNATNGYGDGIAFLDNPQDIQTLKNSLLKCSTQDYWEACIKNSLHKIDFYISYCENFYTEIDCIEDALCARLITPEEIAKQCSSDGKIQKLFSVTNINYKINFQNKQKVLRISRPKLNQIINPNNEQKILSILPNHLTAQNEFYNNGLKLSTFLQGYKPLTKEEICQEGVLELLIKKIKILHSKNLKDYPNFTPIFMVNEINNYESLAKIKLVTQLEHKKILDIASKIDTMDFILCHRDLQLPNILYNGKDIKLIDFEYSGFSSYIWELGNLSAELELEEKQIEKIIHLYGKITRQEILEGQILSNYIWALWSWIYDKIDLGRDYLVRLHKNLKDLNP